MLPKLGRITFSPPRTAEEVNLVYLPPAGGVYGLMGSWGRGSRERSSNCSAPRCPAAAESENETLDLSPEPESRTADSRRPQ